MVISNAQPNMTNADLNSILKAQQEAYFNSGIPSAAQRIDNLNKLLSILHSNEQAIVEAISKDFGNRAHQETRLAELFLCIDGIKYARKRLKKWMRPQKRSVSFWFFGARNTVIPQPLGVVGIVVPWNYPLFLCISPLISALAAGNRCMIKMAANSYHLSQLLQGLFAQHFAADMLTIVHGAKGSEFSALPFDHLIFTGSGNTGRQVMRAAADNLTPVTLELGGKSPTIIAPDYPIIKAAERLLFSKCLNAGQTCIAPDYLFIPESKVDEFIAAAKTIVNNRYPDIESADYTSIINDSAFMRLESTLADAIEKGATAVPLVTGSIANSATRKLPPTLLTRVTPNMRVMSEEIFGPILPIVTYRHMHEVLSYINNQDRPLALYLFSNDKATQTNVINKTRSGGVCLNDTTLHVGQHDMPFGGVGESGMGQYHAMEGFLAMSKLRPIFKQARNPAASRLYPPYGKQFDKIIKIMLRF
ncbi:MAG: coniferyl aldehyde dehydrogenase [Gammaproteobacteria bacterium]|nr:coniferyl aldehyde dehydrogenase [Gammaproteobacteria bacterium]